MIDAAAPAGLVTAWYAVFYDGEADGWWRRLCAPGFGHVCALGYCPEQRVWVVYDVTLRRTWVQVMTSAEMDVWFGALPPHRRVLHLPARNEGRPARLGFWCTPAVAHLLGVPSRALRPQALYRDLVAQGARPAFESQAE